MARLGKLVGMPHTQSAVKVLCRGTSRQPHSRVIARYSWSEAEHAWERIDRNATDDMSVSADLQMEARPLFKCPCGRRARFDHDELQHLLQQAADDGKHLTV